MILRRDVYKILGDDLILKVNPRTIRKHATPPLYSWRKKTDFIRKKRWGKVILRPLLFPYTSLFIYNGKWDLSTIPFKEFYAYSCMHDLYANKDDFRNSKWYKKAKSDIELNGRFARKEKVYTSINELDIFFEEYLLNMLKSMEKNGYAKHKAPDACGVMISRSGELIKSLGMGNHRLAAAQLVGINSIPVKVTRVHRKWFREIGGILKNKKLQNLKTALSEVELQHT